MNPNIIPILESYGIPIIVAEYVPPITALAAANPGQTPTQLATDEDGALKHFLRGKLGKVGFFADLIWPIVSPTLDALLLQAATEVEANIATNPPSA